MKLPLGEMETEKREYIPWSFPRAFLDAQRQGNSFKRQSVVLKITFVFLEHWEKILTHFSFSTLACFWGKIYFGNIFIYILISEII